MEAERAKDGVLEVLDGGADDAGRTGGVDVVREPSGVATKRPELCVKSFKFRVDRNAESTASEREALLHSGRRIAPWFALKEAVAVGADEEISCRC
jgi:hypothetical protein